MLIQQATRDEPEVIDISVLNDSGSIAFAGMGMRFRGGLLSEVASADGIKATLMTASGDMKLFAGVVLEDIPINRHGIVRAYGKVDKIFYEPEAVTVPADEFLQPGATPGSWTDGYVYDSLVVMQESMLKSLQSWEETNITADPAPLGKGFVRAL